mmetsp:Transcript_98903/g.282822  ORF Transcript_98903/g.282822 Transcript_98903/m.282822 type:complete len:289 (+) Transcript_98903:278-1144(+)
MLMLGARRLSPHVATHAWAFRCASHGLRHMRASARLAPHVTCPCHVCHLPGPCFGSCSCTCLELCPPPHTSRSRHLPYTCTRHLPHAAGGGARSRAPRHCLIHSYIHCTPTHAPESAHALHRCRTLASRQRAARPFPSDFPPDCSPLSVFHRLIAVLHIWYLVVAVRQYGLCLDRFVHGGRRFPATAADQPKQRLPTDRGYSRWSLHNDGRALALWKEVGNKGDDDFSRPGLHLGMGYPNPREECDGVNFGGLERPWVGGGRLSDFDSSSSETKFQVVPRGQRGHVHS